MWIEIVYASLSLVLIETYLVLCELKKHLTIRNTELNKEEENENSRTMYS